MKFICIPFHDFKDFRITGIATREIQILDILLKKYKFEEILIINKKRTMLNMKLIKNNLNYILPETSYQREIYNNIFDLKKYNNTLSGDILGQIFLKRIWWEKQYQKIIKELPLDLKDTIIYSNNPFSSKLLESLKKRGAIIIFDCMDNFAIHPSFSNKERDWALEAYKRLAKISDFFSANSQQTSCFIFKKTGRKPFLIKNGVNLEEKEKNITIIEEKIKMRIELAKKEKNIHKVLGYIGKLGKRIDSTFLNLLCKESPNDLIVLIGPFLKNQEKELKKVINSNQNLIYFSGVPSAYVMGILSLFDILIIPHAVGKNENGGDPLKLYQYLQLNKPILSTSIIGVNEFEKNILISNDVQEWVNNKLYLKKENYVGKKIYWEKRLDKLLNFLDLIVERNKNA
ncbi:MAG: hypothetical protein ACRC4T_19115 [Cetobacterium sp.]